MKQKNLETRISKMKVGDKFILGTNPEREAALRAAKVLRKAGIIDFQITTRQQEGAFVVVAI